MHVIRCHYRTTVEAGHAINVGIIGHLLTIYKTSKIIPIMLEDTGKPHAANWNCTIWCVTVKMLQYDTS